MRHKAVLKIDLFGLCENTCFPWQPIADSMIGVCLKILISKLLLILDYLT